MTKELIVTPRASLDDTLYTLIVSIQPDLPAFRSYMGKRGVTVEERKDGAYEADYRPIGIRMMVGYQPSLELTLPAHDRNVTFNLGTLMHINSPLGKDIVENEAEEILKSIREVEDPESIQIVASLYRKHPV